uniref:Methyltransferase-like protein 15 homolog n=1 Tax=Clastoptera arizonana TaxID=38151 RepID=A0A1B6E9I8_9HEMI
MYVISRYIFRTQSRHTYKTFYVLNRFQSVDKQTPMNIENPPHIPVLLNEVIEYLKPKKGSVLIDMTFGAGGHTKALLENTPALKIICLDRDFTAYNYAIKLSEKHPNKIIPLLGKFSELPRLLKDLGIKQNSIDGILFDFGCSSMQFDTAERGFSISKDGPLDMRMDGTRFPNTPTAAEVLANADEEDLYRIFKIYGEEKNSRKIARAIVEARYTFCSLQTTKELANFVAGICDADFRKDKLQRNVHFATKIFQALRIFVNNELNEINYGMIVAHKYLKVGGRLVTLSFHSLEDTIVKRHLTGHVIDNVIGSLPLKYCDHGTTTDEESMKDIMSPSWKIVTKHVVLPTDEEVEQNARSRSAKLRSAIKIR